MKEKYERKLETPRSEDFDDRRDWIYENHLTRTEWGETPRERRQAADKRLSNRLGEIVRRGERLGWIAGITLIVSLSVTAIPNLGGLGVFAMWIVGYYQGKYSLLDSCERGAFNTQLSKWESDGQPAR